MNDNEQGWYDRERRIIQQEQCKSQQEEGRGGTAPPALSTRTMSISAAIADYIDSIAGTFTTMQLCSDLGITDTKTKAIVRTTLNRFKQDKIEPDGNRAGVWRKANRERVFMDLLHVRTEETNLRLPFGLNPLVDIYGGDIIEFAGDTNVGKTALCLKISKENLALGWRVWYFNSEMSAEKLHKRLKLFGDFPIGHPNFYALERSTDFHDVLEPGMGNLNIIDFLEMSGDFYKVAGYISAIHQKLRGAVCIVCLQKRDRNSDLGLGGLRSIEKASLVLSLRCGNPNTCKIIKAKSRKTDYSLDGRKIDFKLVDGCKFVTVSSWYE